MKNIQEAEVGSNHSSAEWHKYSATQKQTLPWTYFIPNYELVTVQATSLVEEKQTPLLLCMPV